MCAFLSEALGASQNVPDAFARLVSVTRTDCQPDTGQRLARLGVSADAQTFFVNNEYFAPQVEGYTLVGFTLHPTATWQVHPRVSLTAGAQMLLYGGSDRFHHVWPTLTASWHVTPHFNIMMGTLPGPASHALPEPALNPEDQLTERPELGMQLNIRRPHLTGNVWVNWRHFIFRGDTVPERFTAGLSLRFHPREGRFELPAWATFDHIGGQISNFPDTMQSTANVGVEPRVNLATHGRWTRRVTIGVHAMLYHAMAGASVRPFADGWGVMPHVALQARLFHADVAWWVARDFYAPHGNFLFGSVSNYDRCVYTRRRSLLTATAALVKDVGDVLRFTLQARALYDTRDGRFDYAYSALMVVTPGWHR